MTTDKPHFIRRTLLAGLLARRRNIQMQGNSRSLLFSPPKLKNNCKKCTEYRPVRTASLFLIIGP